MIMSAIPTRKKLKEAYAVIGTGDPLSGKQSIFKIGNRKKKLLKEKKEAYSSHKISTLLKSLNNPTLFWKEVRSLDPNRRTTNSIDINEWYSYFVNIFQAQKPAPSIRGEPSDDEYIYRNIMDDKILNSPISEDEVRQSIKSLKRNKSLGPDDILNEMISNGHNVLTLTPFSARVFQSIFERGSFLYEWAKPIILLIHKKGDINVCDNFRPMSLTSLLSKVYASILNRRFTLFADALGLLPEEQAGFRESYSTVDDIFSLYAMVQKQFSKNQKLYVAFIDYRKCFDSINRQALFKTVECNGITGTFLNPIEVLYTTVLAAVRNNSETSNYFQCPIVFKQGCLLSPKLFTIVIAEVSKFSKIINPHATHGVQFTPGLKTTHHFFFADDAILVSDTFSGLQNKLNLIEMQ